MYLDICLGISLIFIMAETKKKSQYNFGGHNFDTALYL